MASSKGHFGGSLLSSPASSRSSPWPIYPWKNGGASVPPARDGRPKVVRWSALSLRRFNSPILIQFESARSTNVTIPPLSHKDASPLDFDEYNSMFRLFLCRCGYDGRNSFPANARRKGAQFHVSNCEQLLTCPILEGK